MMNAHLEERTVNGKVWEIHEILPYVGDYCADWARSNDLGEWWFPSPEEWTMVRDWLGDFGELPPEIRLLSDREIDNFLDALAKDYVGHEGDVPDPNFYRKIKQRYPMCHVEL